MKLSIGNFAWNLSFGNFRSIALVWGPSFGSFSFGAFALELSLWNLRVGTFADKPSCKHCFGGTGINRVSLWPLSKVSLNGKDQKSLFSQLGLLRGSYII